MAAETVSTFTAHNVRLNDGTQTFPSIGATMDQNPVTRCVGRLLHTLYPDGLKGRTLIDVGCLEGGFAAEFARMGIDATGVEVRDSNFRNCLRVRDGLNLPNLHFIQGDANDIARYGRFDVFFVSGLLYHLDRPRKFLEDVARNCGKALVLWTHVTQAEANEASRTYTLSDLCENEGLMGRWYDEHGDIPESELDGMKWASWSNGKSFWVQKEYLLQLLKDLGFDLVFEQFDVMGDIVTDMTEGFYRKIDRVMLVAIKSGLPVDPPMAGRPRPLSPDRPAPPVVRSDAEWRALAAEQALAHARATLDAVHASTSWRLTAPIRGLRRLVGGRRDG